MFHHILRRNREAPSPVAGSITSTLNEQRHMTRRNSAETLATLVNLENQGEEEPDRSRSVLSRRGGYVGREQVAGDEDDQSIFTMGSDETLINQVKIFDVPVSQFTVVRELPIISTFLQLGVEVFESAHVFEMFRKQVGQEREDEYGAMLLTSSSVMSLFKKQSPFMVIHGHGRNGNESATRHSKREICRVYFRVVSNHVSYYILRFGGETLQSHIQPNQEPHHQRLFEVVLMNNNSHRPSVDFEYKGTKLRVMGVTGTTSTFGNGLLKVYVMKPTCELLSDGVVSAKKVAIDNAMFRTVETQDRGAINRFMDSHEMLVNHPIATFVDEGVKVLNKFSRNGTIKLFGREELTDDSYVLLCVLLVLREQEYRKNKGYGKPTGDIEK